MLNKAENIKNRNDKGFRIFLLNLHKIKKILTIHRCNTVGGA